jgi:hypothetical protein
MGPSRKKQKTKPPATDASDAGEGQPQPQIEGSPVGHRPSTPTNKSNNVDNTKMDALSPLKGLKTQVGSFRSSSSSPVTAIPNLYLPSSVA